jgi:hypothetical protein
MLRRNTVLILALAASLTPAGALAQQVKIEGIDSLQVRVNLQVQFNTTSVEEPIGSEWLLRRARFGVRGWFAGWLRGDLEADFGRGRAALTDAVVTFGFAPYAVVRIGQFKKPFDAFELTSSREILVAERDGAPRGTDGPTPDGLVEGLGYSNRDIGAELSGRRDRARWAIGFWNGAGANEAKNDEGEQVGARLSYAVAPGWTVSGGWAAKQIGDPPDADDTAWYDAVELSVTGGEYAEAGLKTLAQVLAGDNWSPELGGGHRSNFVAVQGIAAYHVALFRIPYLVGIEPVVRFGWTDPDTDIDDDEALLSTAGFNFYMHEHLKTQVQVDHLNPAEGDSEFAIRVHTVLEF